MKSTHPPSQVYPPKELMKHIHNKSLVGKPI